VLADECAHKFADAIRASRCFIESGGIAETQEIQQFWVNETSDVFSAFDKDIGARFGKCHAVDVPGIRFADLLSKYGVPFYLKIDIEHADIHCLRALYPSDLPNYVSIEAHDLEYLLILWNLGYRKFKVIDQMRHNSRLPNLSNENPLLRVLKELRWYLDRADLKLRRRSLPYGLGSSGPFAEDTPGGWLSLEDVTYNWLHFHRGQFQRGTLDRRSWYDFHATF